MKPKYKPVPQGVCPLCFGQMARLDRSWWCPAEDPHPGGVIIRDDGLMSVSGLPPRGTVAVSPKIGGTAT